MDGKAFSDSLLEGPRERRDSVLEVNIQDPNNVIYTRKRTGSDPRRRLHATLTIISGEISTQIDSKLRVGYIGRGYNCLDGAIRTHIFDDLKAVYVEEKGTHDRLSYFKNYEEYIKESATRSGIPEVPAGLFSLVSETKENFPFLCWVDRMESYQHYIMEIEQSFYTLKAKIPTGNSASLYQDEDIMYIMKNEFRPETKKKYFTILERYGTHFFKSCTFGSKAELRWSFPEKTDKDALERVSSLHTYRNKILDNADLWKKSGFSADFGKSEDERLGKNILELRRMTHNFMMNEEDKVKGAEQIRFQLEEISTLFTGQTRTSLETAIRAYLEEMKPRKNVEEMKDDGTVALYSLDYGKYVRVDQHGHLYADGVRLNTDCQMKVKKRGTRMALKSLKFKDKFLSKALISSIFHFHRLQFMGPHESFEMFEDYVKACGNLTGSSYMYITPEDRELHHGGDMKRKSRFIVIDVDNRVNLPQGQEQEEPSFLDDEEDMMEEEIEVKVEPIMKQPMGGRRKDKDMARAIWSRTPIKDIGKSNSTSSLFIKDTILLPIIDELTRCIAVHLRDRMVHAKAEKLAGKYVEILSEEKYPLTKGAQPSVLPSIEAINHFVNTVFKVARLSAEAGIMCIIYMNRVLLKTGAVLNPDNWRRLTLCCLMLASKVWEDQAVWNVDFIELFPSINVKELNKLESHLLNFLEFTVGIKASEYVKVYFDLREHSAMSLEERSSKPMDETDLRKLEVRTASSEKQYEKEALRFHKSSSMDVSQLSDKDKHHPHHNNKTGLGILS